MIKLKLFYTEWHFQLFSFVCKLMLSLANSIVPKKAMQFTTATTRALFCTLKSVYKNSTLFIFNFLNMHKNEGFGRIVYNSTI